MYKYNSNLNKNQLKQQTTNNHILKTNLIFLSNLNKNLFPKVKIWSRLGFGFLLYFRLMENL